MTHIYKMTNNRGDRPWDSWTCHLAGTVGLPLHCSPLACTGKEITSCGLLLISQYTSTHKKTIPTHFKSFTFTKRRNLSSILLDWAHWGLTSEIDRQTMLWYTSFRSRCNWPSVMISYKSVPIYHIYYLTSCLIT